MTEPHDRTAAARLRAAADRFITRVGHWAPQRWTPARAQRVHRLVQTLADLAADVEGEPRRPVPRLDNDLALVDQVRVMVADLLLLPDPPPDVLAAATTAITTVDLG